MCEVADKIYAQGLEQGIKQGLEQSIGKNKLENAEAMAISLYESGISEDLIAKAANVSVNLVREWVALSLPEPEVHMCEEAKKIYSQGIEHGKLEKAKAMAISLHESGISEDLIAKAANVNVNLVRKWLGLSLA